MTDVTPDSAFREARARHEAGAIDEAAALYRGVLASCPRHADSLHLLGLLEVERGAPQTGLELIGEAMSIAPGQAIHHNSRALAFRALGRLDEAVHDYRAAVALRPGSGELHCNLAIALTELGRSAEAAAHYGKAAECAPDRPEIWYNLANALAEIGPAAQAEAAFLRAIELEPRLVEAQANFGRWLMRRGRWSDAAARLTIAVRLAPGSAAYWNNLAVVLQELGRHSEAIVCYESALTLEPNRADAHYNLGCLLHIRGRTDDAVARHLAAIAADPRHGGARIALCMAELPILYDTQEEIALRRARYERALENLADSSQDAEIAAALAPAVGATQPFFLPYQGEDDRQLQTRYGEFACRVLAQTRPAVPLAPPPAAGERIRIGIVSGFFCRHTVFRLFLESWIARLDRARFEVTGFHTGKTQDADTLRAAQYCEHFPLEPSTPEGWREAIVAAAPHVLLYPEIGMDPVSGWLAAQRLAPTQCMAWGQPETSGMPTIDFFLSSELMEPEGAARFYTERLAPMPNLGLHYTAETLQLQPLDRTLFGAEPNVPIFFSGQALYKYLPCYDVVFPRIAAMLGPCKFLFIAFAKSEDVTGAFRARLERAFAAAGLSAEDHCVILPQMPQELFIAAAAASDVILDTPGWSGGRSTLDLLGADRPIVTLPGDFMRGRHTAAILRRIGCEETIASSLDHYVEIAVRLGRDRAARASLAGFVAANKHRAFEDMDYIRALEDFLEAAARSRLA
ncbi:tetratricopeptide repeat protein [Methylosinus sp. H3A]|uniref:tetratricopeptide repeat protein n=1 Tax=Methylosinus sp. H3A TaxID=2785786 RepID=UPI0018C2E79A|nr:tetratricopeptide repeat protein [Methylosinus sp. H3A]MBG0809212.1 tetratricopeptide repeat protein [Methylosinus sp. H3A]